MGRANIKFCHLLFIFLFGVGLIKNTDLIVLCTSTKPEDDILEIVARKHGIKFFRGSLKDVIARWVGAADEYKVDYFVEVDGDDIFIDPELIDSTIAQMRQRPCDLLKWPSNLIAGLFPACLSVEALRKIIKLKNTDDTGYWDFYFTENSLFDIRELLVENQAFFNPNIRLTLDYQEDLDLFRKVFDEFDADINNVPSRQIVDLLNKKPELAQINLFRQRQYLNNREKNRSKLVLKDKYKNRLLKLPV